MALKYFCPQTTVNSKTDPPNFIVRAELFTLVCVSQYIYII